MIRTLLASLLVILFFGATLDPKTYAYSQDLQGIFGHASKTTSIENSSPTISKQYQLYGIMVIGSSYCISIRNIHTGKRSWLSTQLNSGYFTVNSFDTTEKILDCQIGGSTHLLKLKKPDGVAPISITKKYVRPSNVTANAQTNPESGVLEPTNNRTSQRFVRTLEPNNNIHTSKLEGWVEVLEIGTTRPEKSLTAEIVEDINNNSDKSKVSKSPVRNPRNIAALKNYRQ